MLSHLRSALDDASPHQGRKIAAIYLLIFAGNAVVWTWAFVALSDQPTLLGTAFLAYVLDCATPSMPITSRQLITWCAS